eukprot:gene19156-19527_t
MKSVNQAIQIFICFCYHNDIEAGPTFTLKIKADLWTALRDTPLSDVEALLDNIYDKVGPEVIGETVVFNAEQALERVPTFAAVASRNLVRLLQSDLGKQAFEDLQAIKAELD